MQLVITEKPSVAISFARILGAAQRRDGYLEGNGFLVSWCIGHLVELAEPGSYDERYNKWKREDLPIIPQDWSYRILPPTRKPFREGFASLKPSAEYDTLYASALCRERADWIVGINATRLFSCLYGETLNIGRVMTPTLAMVVDDYSGLPAHPGRSSAQPGRVSAHLIRSAL